MDYRAGMFFYALAFLLGDIFVQQLRFLPSHFVLATITILACLLCSILFIYKKRFVNTLFKKELTLSICFILLIIIGVVYASIQAEQRLLYRLDESLIGKSLLVTGFVSNIPNINGHVSRFILDVESVQNISSDAEARLQTSLINNFPKKIRLSWYYGEEISAAEKWQFEVRLKPPHGFMNPGGFDYESWLFQNRLDATGYVRKSAFNHRIYNVSNDSYLYKINAYRQMLGQWIDSIASKNHNGSEEDKTKIGAFSLLKALAIGDKTSISSSQWKVLINTGTSHLMAISGLHIGLAALFAYVVVRRLIPSWLAKRIPAQHVALTGGMFMALLYALIAGLSIPTQRAIIMLFVVSVMMLVRRNHRPIDALGFAILAVLIFDPLAVLAVGFWFSFAAVSVIFLSLKFSLLQQTADASVMDKVRLTLQRWVGLQLTISVFLLPLSLFMFQQVSLVSPIANLVLIPYVSFLVVPTVLLAIVFAFLLPDLSEWLFTLAANMIEWIWPVLEYLSTRSYAVWVKGTINITELFVFTAFILLLFVIIKKYDFIAIQKLNIRHKKKVVTLLMSTAFIFLFFFYDSSRLNKGEYIVTILDVGQGSAAVLQTQNHTIVFDAGARFSDKLDSGRSVVIPYLRSQGIQSLDYLIISHGDNDHIGGAQSIIDEYLDISVLGQDLNKLNVANKKKCFEGLNWQWDDVEFTFLSPSPSKSEDLPVKVKRNNRSCVLRVVSAYGSVLFTGDVEKKVEKRLVETYGDNLKSDVFIVPHHGSNTSSSAAFINSVKPELSLISVGYKNRYRLPSDKVIDRYKSSKATMLQTAKSGAITVKFADKNGLEVTQYRERRRKYWNHLIN